MGTSLFRTFLLLFILAGGASSPALGQAKTLYWRSLDVSATLDNEGSLHVRERQEMVFDGAWNGGERIFRLRPGQRLILNRISRIATANEKIELSRGNLAKVDQYKWFRNNTLRWRSRLPSAPPFADEIITYEIDYTLSNILLNTPEGFRLNHDFAFSNRVGPINHFSLKLLLDSDWQSPKGSRIEMESGVLPPGRSMVVGLDLTNSSPTAKTNVKTYVKPHKRQRKIKQSPGTSAAARYLLAALIVVFFFWRAHVFYRHEKEHQRFSDPVPPSLIDTAWLEEHVFSLKPEVVGAVWDKTTDSHEVAAILARMVVEGKLKSWVKPKSIPIFGTDVLHLELLVDRETLAGYERKIVDGFFIAGEKTDTKTVKDYYRSKSKVFTPVDKISDPLAKRVKGLTARLKAPLLWGWLMSGLMFFVAFFLLLATCVIYQGEFEFVESAVFISVVVFFIGLVQAWVYSKRVLNLKTQMYRVFVPQIFLIGLAGYYLLIESENLSPLFLLGISLLYLSQISMIFFAAKNRDSEEGVALRIRLASARKYFKRELRRQSPDLLDRWFPYLVAFGLGKHVDKWFGRYGAGSVSVYRSTSGSGSFSSGGGFTGGGGMFGGGGASGSWTAAASQMAGGVGASGSAGGGGGGSSGGGGGGGW